MAVARAQPPAGRGPAEPRDLRRHRPHLRDRTKAGKRGQIGYVWDAALPVGTVLPSQKTGTVTFIVARRGDQGLGQWLDERRNVADDYLRVFGEAPPPLPALALSIDTNATRSSAEAMFGRIELQPR